MIDVLTYAVSAMVGFYLLCMAGYALLMVAALIKRSYEIVVLGK